MDQDRLLCFTYLRLDRGFATTENGEIRRTFSFSYIYSFFRRREWPSNRAYIKRTRIRSSPSVSKLHHYFTTHSDSLQYSLSFPAQNPPTMPAKQTALISGANSGIGLAVATQLAKDHGYHVIIGSRKLAAGEQVAAALAADGYSASAIQLDVSTDTSIAAATSWIECEFGSLDVLINNAGILLDYVPGILEANKGLSTRELFDQTFSTNVVGAACLTEACLPLLRKAEVPRVVFVSSRMGSLSIATDKTSAVYSMDYKAYDSSKAALNMLALNYARILEGDGAMVNLVCPGLVKTKMTNNHPWGTSTEVGAQRIVELATAGKGGPTATYSDREGIVPW
jgi:NAD(P)-dependent dehydrogenase (short-subunit alcohol dehydrogenase family)